MICTSICGADWSHSTRSKAEGNTHRLWNVQTLTSCVSVATYACLQIAQRSHSAKFKETTLLQCLSAADLCLWRQH